VEKMRVDPAAAGVAAYDLVQKIFLLLVERGALSVDDAQLSFGIPSMRSRASWIPNGPP
jgi:hypothetical protein